MKRKKSKKIDLKQLLAKAAEEGIKEVFEIAILALITGAALELVLIAVPAVAFGSAIAKLVKVKFLD